MTLEEFCKQHWDYYLMLERDFLEVERYVSFDLGDNYLYDGSTPSDLGNSRTFSNEFVKQYQAICSEVDVLMKSICVELSGQSTNAQSADDMEDYTLVVLNHWGNIKQQKVKLKDIKLQPFINWETTPNYKSPDWWSPYNKVKHKRLANFEKANLKNVLNALAGLFILECYLVKYIGDRDNTRDVPNDRSKLFELENYPTKWLVIGRELYAELS